MIYKKLGSSGLPVSVLSFGAWITFGPQIDIKKGKQCLTLAYDEGINFFDNAEVYEYGEAERIMGKALAELSWTRDSFLVSSKVFFGDNPKPKPTQCGLHRKHVIEACHAALKRLQVEYIDVFFCHRPDTSTPMEEVVETMTTLIRQGKVLYWGTSEWSAAQIMHAYAVAQDRHLIPPVTEQPQYNMLHRNRVENEYKILYDKLRYGTTIWSPLASGLLTGKYNDGIPENSRINLPGYEWLKKLLIDQYAPTRLKVIRKLSVIADNVGIPLARLAIAWTLKNSNVSTVILGASRIEQLKENLKALDDVKLIDDSIMKKIKSELSRIPNTLSHGNEG